MAIGEARSGSFTEHHWVVVSRRYPWGEPLRARGAAPHDPSAASCMSFGEP
jgi:hypothetical protein